MTQIAAALFAGDAVEACSDLERFYLVRDNYLFRWPLGSSTD